MAEAETTPAAAPAPAPAPVPTPRKVHAVTIPAGKLHGPNADRAAQIQRVYGPILGGVVHVRNQGTYNFLSADPSDTVKYPKVHARGGLDRYQWEPSPTDPTVKFGYLIPEEPV